MNLEDLRQTSDLLARLDEEEFAFFESLSTELVLEPDEVLFRENDQARRFFIIAEGILALEVERPAKPATTVQTLSDGALVGLSWRLTPHRWMWTARAVTGLRLAVMDATFVRDECERNADLDRLMWEIVAREASQRLHYARIQLLDLYGKG
ncbi:MAG: Crp/Fnr family transcriptional regulator [Actinobacteria bacterium]|nr:MAG: Crp/Fnr family transcriptional regulator [Actinomycetota bacterium]